MKKAISNNNKNIYAPDTAGKWKEKNTVYIDQLKNDRLGWIHFTIANWLGWIHLQIGWDGFNCKLIGWDGFTCKLIGWDGFTCKLVGINHKLIGWDGFTSCET